MRNSLKDCKKGRRRSRKGRGERNGVKKQDRKTRTSMSEREWRLKREEGEREMGERMGSKRCGRKCMRKKM